MGLLAVEHASMFYGAVAAPVGDGGESVVGDVPGRGPALQHYWLWGRDPLQPARGHVAPGLPDRLTDGHEMVVVGEAHVDAFDRLRSEEHTSELQSRQYLVCRLMLEKRKM